MTTPACPATTTSVGRATGISGTGRHSSPNPAMTAGRLNRNRYRPSAPSNRWWSISVRIAGCTPSPGAEAPTRRAPASAELSGEDFSQPALRATIAASRAAQPSLPSSASASAAISADGRASPGSSSTRRRSRSGARASSRSPTAPP
nr:hypothetical protein [Frankia nepalensis]